MPPLLLGLGEQRILPASDLQKYSLGSDVVHARATETSLLIKGVRPGTGDLWVRKADGIEEHRTIRVEKPDSTSGVPPALLRAISQLNEIEVYFSAAGVILRGEIRTLAEAARVHALRALNPEAVHDETELSDSLIESGRQKLEDCLSRTGQKAFLHVQQLGKRLSVMGSIPLSKNRPAIEKQILAAFPLTDIQIDSLPDDSPTIHFRVFLLELKHSNFGSLGLSWPERAEGAFRVSSWGIQQAFQIDLALQALEGEGAAKILSRPELVVRAPGDAELFAGGELPIRTKSAYVSNVAWKPYGLSLKLHVVQVAGNTVRLDILTEVSQLDTTTLMEEIPGIQANRMKTQVDARFDQPLLLSGLLQEGTREQAKGLPALRKIPILGSLFGSQDYLNQRSELVAVLVPSRVPPRAPMENFSRLLPRGSIPPARDWISPSRERELRTSPDFPWNALR